VGVGGTVDGSGTALMLGKRLAGAIWGGLCRMREGTTQGIRAVGAIRGAATVPPAGSPAWGTSCGCRQRPGSPPPLPYRHTGGVAPRGPPSPDMGGRWPRPLPPGPRGHGEQCVPLPVLLRCLMRSIPPAGEGSTITIIYIRIGFVRASIS